MHINLALSLSKHATYTFNPDGLSLVPDYIIASAYASVSYFCSGILFDNDFGRGDVACLAGYYYLYGIFYGCATEVFIDQGGKYATTRVNVGEPNVPINNAGFIRDEASGVYGKLAYPVF